jgi:hypothetical protein
MGLLVTDRSEKIDIAQIFITCNELNICSDGTMCGWKMDGWKRNEMERSGRMQRETTNFPRVCMDSPIIKFYLAI